MSYVGLKGACLMHIMQYAAIQVINHSRKSELSPKTCYSFSGHRVLGGSKPDENVLSGSWCNPWLGLCVQLHCTSCQVTTKNGSIWIAVPCVTMKLGLVLTYRHSARAAESDMPAPIQFTRLSSQITLPFWTDNPSARNSGLTTKSEKVIIRRGWATMLEVCCLSRQAQ